MEVGEVRVVHRETVTYNIEVKGHGIIVSLNIDEHGTVKVTGRYSQTASIHFGLAEFNSKYLRQVHAAIGAVLEAMED